jgi:predicted Zn-dependent protease
MNVLSSSELILFQKAQEFLRNGNHSEARAILVSLNEESRAHPDVMEATLETHAQAQEWDAALAVAKSLCDQVPDSEFAWMYHACSLNELKRTAEAFDVLCLAAEKLPTVPIIPYNLACLACKLGRLKDASHWIRRASQVGGRAEVKLMALSDPDLAPLLDEVCSL